MSHEAIRNPQTITQENARAFRAHGLDFTRDEVTSFEDDHDRGVRTIKIRAPRTFIDLGRRR